MEIRKAVFGDYDEMMELWRVCGISLTDSDSRDKIERFMKKNEETCLVGIADNRMIAAVLGGSDGRRGLVHHLAVHPEYQKKGYGREMLNVLEKAFAKEGIDKMSFWVKKNNFKVVDFYERLGYELREDIATMSKFI